MPPGFKITAGRAKLFRGEAFILMGTETEMLDANAFPIDITGMVFGDVLNATMPGFGIAL